MSRAGLNFTIFIAISFLFLTPPAVAKVSVNVPLGNWSYDAIYKLKGLGLIQSDMRDTRPWTRLEMARLVVEAEDPIIPVVIDANVRAAYRAGLNLEDSLCRTAGRHINLPHAKMFQIFEYCGFHNEGIIVIISRISSNFNQ